MRGAATQGAARQPRTPSTEITDREIALLGYIADGLTNAQIGAIVGFDGETIKKRVRVLSSKLATERAVPHCNRAALVAAGFRRGLVR